MRLLVTSSLEIPSSGSGDDVQAAAFIPLQPLLAVNVDNNIYGTFFIMAGSWVELSDSVLRFNDIIEQEARRYPRPRPSSSRARAPLAVALYSAQSTHLTRVSALFVLGMRGGR